jgi:hypothetical protein
VVVGHYAAALVAKERDPSSPLWLLLASSMILDFAMAGLVLAGLESMRPDPSAPGPALASMQIDMTYSHDLVPVLGWTLGVGLLAYALTRRRETALWAAGLVAFHEVCDLVSGFPHFVMGPGTSELGLGLYVQAPLAALGIELALGLACVAWFTRRAAISRGKKVGLYAAVVFGVAVLLPAAL